MLFSGQELKTLKSADTYGANRENIKTPWTSQTFGVCLFSCHIKRGGKRYRVTHGQLKNVVHEIQMS